MNSNHHSTLARVQVYHGRCRISNQKNVEKPKSRPVANNDSKKRKPCPKQKSRYQHAAIKFLVKVSPLNSGVDLEGTLNKTQYPYPGIIFRHYLRVEDKLPEILKGSKLACPKVSPTGGDLEGAGGPTP